MYNPCNHEYEHVSNIKFDKWFIFGLNFSSLNNSSRYTGSL